MHHKIESLTVSHAEHTYDAGQLSLNGEINTLFSSSKIPFIVTDSHQKDNPIVHVNEAFLAMTGYSYLEVMGHNCRFLQGKYTSKETVSKIRKAISENRSLSCVVLNYTKKGEPFWNALFLAPLKNSQGENQFFIASQMDVTKIMSSVPTLDKVQEASKQAVDSLVAETENNTLIENHSYNIEKECSTQHLEQIFGSISAQNILAGSADLALILEKSKTSEINISFSL